MTIRAAIALAAMSLLAGTSAADTQCPGIITIGEGADKVATPVANRPIGDACLDTLIVDNLAEGPTTAAMVPSSPS